MAITFGTGRLIVRPWTEEPDDVRRAFDIYSRVEVARWLGRGGDPLADPERAIRMIRRWNERSAEFGEPYGIWAVQRRDTALVVGTVLLVPLPGVGGESTSDVEVGWHLHPDSWGNGYATEAARGALDRGFAAGLSEIHAVVWPGNDASVAVTRRLGMEPLGRRTDWYDGAEVDAFRLRR
ncbi:GNAT family N-acetyltransferase [Plantactinospora sp. KBS50]|uniref:GNAT family N-acetyltransferase n=1 Tax=Plantactinospora sp. KBS50 TaxID=2024580 RepID=UPI000BAAFBF5|nr:GNAT family N-acetyltransferase [Plantactinospora sp. KBS50]ASW54037.1 GNAT family N-acetyltransferase [Plantactinospora sp. KBS50]